MRRKPEQPDAYRILQGSNSRWLIFLRPRRSPSTSKLPSFFVSRRLNCAHAADSSATHLLGAARTGAEDECNLETPTRVARRSSVVVARCVLAIFALDCLLLLRGYAVSPVLTTAI